VAFCCDFAGIRLSNFVTSDSRGLIVGRCKFARSDFLTSAFFDLATSRTEKPLKSQQNHNIKQPKHDAEKLQIQSVQPVVAIMRGDCIAKLTVLVLI
jgi:hypothetical protein